MKICPNCSKSFSTKASLRQHMMSHGPVPRTKTQIRVAQPATRKRGFQSKRNSGSTSVGDVSFSGKELIQMSWQSGVATTILNPFSASCPIGHLRGMATHYELAEYKSLKFEYVPSVGTTSNGRFFMAIDYDSTDLPKTEEQCYMYNPNVSSAVWERCVISADVAKLNKRYWLDRHTITGSLVAYNNYGSSKGTTEVPGQIWAHYSVKMSNPSPTLTTSSQVYGGSLQAPFYTEQWQQDLGPTYTFTGPGEKVAYESNKEDQHKQYKSIDKVLDPSLSSKLHSSVKNGWRFASDITKENKIAPFTNFASTDRMFRRYATISCKPETMMNMNLTMNSGLMTPSHVDYLDYDYQIEDDDGKIIAGPHKMDILERGFFATLHFYVQQVKRIHLMINLTLKAKALAQAVGEYCQATPGTYTVPIVTTFSVVSWAVARNNRLRITGPANLPPQSSPMALADFQGYEEPKKTNPVPSEELQPHELSVEVDGVLHALDLEDLESFHTLNCKECD